MVFIPGNALNNNLDGGAADDIIIGFEGNDRLRGFAGADILIGDADQDTLVGGTGDDIMDGGAGRDRLIWNNGDGSDIMNGGADGDVVEVNGSNGAVGDIFVLSQNNATVPNDVVFQRTNLGLFSLSVDNVEQFEVNGLGGNDRFTVNNLTGTEVSRVIFNGGAGNDTLDGSLATTSLTAIGGSGNDSLIGGTSNNTLNGVDPSAINPGQGEIDILRAGAGSDRFILGDDVGATGRVYYNDGLAGPGIGDYARIIGFSSTQDTIQLAGTSANYRLVSVGGILNQGAAAADTGIYRVGASGSELIGVLQDVAVSTLNLNAGYFDYVI